MKTSHYILILLTLSLYSCKPFRDVSGITNDRTNITGTYLNDCDSIDDSNSSRMEYNIQLWKIIDRKYTGADKGLSVRIMETGNDKLLAQLIKQDSIISEKLIKGYFRNDQCYYKRRVFYIVPILPFLWWFENKQTRFYCNPDYLVVESKIDAGGAFIFMAGGSNNSAGRFYQRL